MDDADSELLCRSAAGDREAFGRFAHRHAASVLRYCLLRVADRHAAEDAAQEALLRLFRQTEEGKVPAEPLPWLLAVARRCCQEANRRLRRHGAVPLDEDEAVGPSPSRDGKPDLPAALRALNDFESAVLHLKHTEGLTCKAIAARLGSPLGTITAALSRAYAKLRTELLREAHS